MTIREQIGRWWEGTFVPRKNDPSSALIFTGGDQKIHWTARACRATLIYFRDNHRWIIGLTIAVALAVYAKTR